MPTYQYTCTECGEPVEAVQKFSDAPLTECSVCGGRLRKVFSPVGIVFNIRPFERPGMMKLGAFFMNVSFYGSIHISLSTPAQFSGNR